MLRIHQDRGCTRDLAMRGDVGGEDRPAPCERLQDRQSEALATRERGDQRGAPVERLEVRTVDGPEHVHPRAVELGQDRRRAPSRRSGDDQADVGMARRDRGERPDDRRVALARLDGADDEDVRLPDPEPREPGDGLARVGGAGGTEIAERDVSQPLGLEAGVEEIVERVAATVPARPRLRRRRDPARARESACRAP